MNIVDRKTFLEFPDGIVFCKYIPSGTNYCDCFEGLCIKIKTYRHEEDDVDGDYKKGDGFDFLLMQLSDAKSSSRDGTYDEEEMFAIFENEDIDISSPDTINKRRLSSVHFATPPLSVSSIDLNSKLVKRRSLALP